MRNLGAGVLASLFLSLSAFAQGTVFFNNQTSTGDAPVSWGWPVGDFGPVGPGYTAQLFLVNGSKMTPLTPTTTFRDSSPTTP